MLKKPRIKGISCRKYIILEVLEKYHRALSYEEIDSLLNIKTVEETSEMNNSLSELEEDFEIYRTNKGRYMLFDESNLKKGIIRINKNNK